MQSIVLLGKVFKTRIVSGVFVRFSNSLGSYPQASGLGNGDPAPPHLLEIMLLFTRGRERCGREKEAKRQTWKQKYLFSLFVFRDGRFGDIAKM